VIATLVLAALAVYFVERCRPLFLTWVERRYPFRPAAKPEPIPPDLASLAVSEFAEEWAQADTLRAMRELYEECGDWDPVRVKFGAAPQK
jgi:hypothetical protein